MNECDERLAGTYARHLIVSSNIVHALERISAKLFRHCQGLQGIFLFRASACTGKDQEYTGGQAQQEGRADSARGKGIQ